jgi:AcrR family transcriptional regulator
MVTPVRKKNSKNYGINPRKLPSQERSKELVASLIQTTARILLRDGWHGLTTNRVAREAGVSVGSLYQYFPGKEALLHALVEQIAEEMAAHVLAAGEALRSASVEEGIDRIVRVSLEASRKDGPLYRAVLLELPRLETLEIFERINRRLADALAEWIAERRDELEVVDPSLTAHVLVTSLDALTDHALLFRPELLESPRFERELRGLVAGYLGVRPRPARRPKPPRLR